MTDTAITLTPATAMAAGAIAVVASAPLFSAADIGRALAISHSAPARVASTAYNVDTVVVSSYAGVDRLYRVLTAGTSAAAVLAGTTPNYDLASPRDVAFNVRDGTVTWKYLGAGRHCWGFGVITAYTDSQHVTVTVDPTGPFVDVIPSPVWKLGEWSAARGWPACVTFHQGRTWWGGTATKPQTLWASAAGDFENMTPTEPDGTVLDTSAMAIALDDDEVNTIRWLSSFPKGLAAGTASGEFTIGPATTTAPMGPNNIRATRQTDRGSDAGAAQIRASGVILFLQRGGRKLRQLEYDFGTDSFVTIDLTNLSDHITGTGVVEAGYAALPDGHVWLLRNDGTLACLTFDREQKVRAWTRHVLGGTNAVVESLAVVPAPDGATDELMLAVARTINGQTVRTVEYLAAPYRADLSGQTGAYFVDCGLSYRGTPAGLFSGLGHLEGQTVQILADGSARNPAVVTAGAVAATGPASSTVHIGLPFTSRFVSLSPETPAAIGTAQGQFRRINEIILRFLETGGGQYGRADALEAIIFRTLAMGMSQAVPLFTGDRKVAFPAGWDRAGQVQVETSDPLPLTVLALIAEIETNG